MTYAPSHLVDLMAYYTSQGGVNAGIVGSWSTHGRGYHLGKDRIFSDCAYKPGGVCKPGQGWNDYSVKTARDKAGLSNAASGVDLGRINGALVPLWSFSAWLAARCMAKDPDTKDIREVIYWDRARKVVVGWSALAPDRLIDNYGDASHQWHTHISYFRDAEGRDQRPVFRRYFDPEEDTLNRFAVPKVPQETFIATGTWLYDNSDFASSANNIKIDPGRWMPYVGIVLPGVYAVGYVNASGVATGTAYFVKALGQVREIATGGDCTDEVNAAKVAGFNEGKAAGIAEMEPKVQQAAGVEQERLAKASGEAEAARIRSL